MRKTLLVPLIALVLSPLLTGLWVLVDTILFVAAAELAQGTVTGTSQAAEKMWHAHFSYADATGVLRQGKTAWASSFNTQDVGTVLPILYRPEAPETVRIASPWALWGFPALILVPTLAAYALVLRVLRARRD